MRWTSQHTCRVPDCDKSVHGQDLCKRHHERLRTTGSLELDPQRRVRKGVNRRIEQTVDGLLAYTVQSGDCRRWTGTHNKNDGYGLIHMPDRRPTRQLVHRLMHELAIGPIPEGYEVDHVYTRGCRFHDCIWPPHLEAVTPRENALRANAVRDGDGICRKGGHQMTPENTRVIASTGRRRCRACENARKLRDYHNQKEKSHG